MMTPVQIAISQEFLSAFSQLPKKTQKKTTEFISSFTANPKSPGINYEKIRDSQNKGFRSVRVDQKYRAIILKPETGNTFFLLWVDNHDAAYDWARRKKIQINSVTGTLTVIEAINDPATDQPESYNELHGKQAEKSVPTLFKLRNDDLLNLGVPADLLDSVTKICSEEALERLRYQLPVGAYEALYLLAAGTTWQEIEREYINPPASPVDTTDIEAALDRPESKRMFTVVKDQFELENMLEAPLEHWRVFLHPTQRKLVERHWNGPVRVLGGAGTGKTVVAMHRARWLAKNVLNAGSNEKVLFTTFTANLTLDIEANLRKICSNEEMQRIEVVHLHRWVSEFLKNRDYPHQIIFPDDERYKTIWDQALSLIDDSVDQPKSFYKEEWERVVLPQNVMSMADYFKASRTGRGVALNRKQRALIWPVFDQVRLQLKQQGLRTQEDATLDATNLLKEYPLHDLYRSVVIDETQDMGSESLGLVRQLVKPNANDIFAVGDGHQRIYLRKAIMGHCGIKIVGRSHKLRINYRTTEEIRRFAISVLENIPIDDMDGGTDSSHDYLSLMHGVDPIISEFCNCADESEYIAKEVKKLIEEGVLTQDICIAMRISEGFSAIEECLVNAGIQTQIVSRSKDNRPSPGVRFATMHRIKGLEFRYVFIASANEGIVPLKVSTQSTEDPVEARARELNERALLHVAATRAIQGLYISTSGPISPYL